MVVTTRLLESAVESQVTRAVSILAEPQGRNTAPCVYWAARAVFEKDPKGVMLVMPSDHTIPRLADFQNTVTRAVAWAKSHDDLVTLGVSPTRPETGYGYLKTANGLTGVEGSGGFGVEAFVEKPDLARATEYIQTGNYLWNGGMFVWRADVILKAFDDFMPEMRREWEAAGRKVEVAYPRMTATSIDYGVMERARNVVTFTLDCGWDDLGSWTSLEALAEKLSARHEAGVVTGGQAISVESYGCIVDAPGKLVALLGVEDLIVVQQGDAILIAKKDRAQDIKLIVEKVKATRPELA